MTQILIFITGHAVYNFILTEQYCITQQYKSYIACHPATPSYLGPRLSFSVFVTIVQSGVHELIGGIIINGYSNVVGLDL